MNLPNKLTVARTVLSPVFVAFVMLSSIPNNYLWAALVFTIASLTDMFDGRIARKRNIVTNFGKFLDPLADKILVTSAVVLFVWLNLASPIVALIIIVRDFVISAIRLLAVSSDGKVIAANIWGKIKTLLSMISIIAILLLMFLSQNLGLIPSEPVRLGANIAMWVIAAITALSGAIYVKDNASLLSDVK